MKSRINLKDCAIGASFLLIIIILLGLSGRFLALGDTASIILIQAAIILLPVSLTLLVLRHSYTAIISIISIMAAIAAVWNDAKYEKETCNESCVVIYQKNLLSKAWPRYQLAADIVASEPSIVTLQEVSLHNYKYMPNLFDHFKTSVFCPFRTDQYVAILTSLDTIKNSAFCLPNNGMAGLQVKMPNGTSTWIVSIHLEWPFPFNGYQQSFAIAKHLQKLDEPIIISGDFNTVPWSGSVSRIKAASGTERLGPIMNTYRLGSALFPLPIDMLLLPDGISGSIETRPYHGSDHLGLLARISYLPTHPF